MALIQLETQVSAETLLHAIEQLSPRDLERLRKRILAVRAGRRASALPRKESRLLSKINQPFAGQLRYDELIAKRRTDALSQIEYAELLALTQQNEAFAVQHVRSLSELASLRQITLTDLMQQLGIQKLPYAN